MGKIVEFPRKMELKEDYTWLQNPDKYNPDPEYLRELIDKIGVSQRKAAEMIGIPERTFRDYLNRKGSSRASYPVQFALECLAINQQQTN